MKFLRSVVAAFSLLTALPVPDWNIDGDDIARSVKFFPLVGLVLGGLLFLLALFAGKHLPVPVAAAVLTIAPEFFTKAFHLDGLADTADGFWSGRSRERIMEIMKDSGIGAMGVFAVLSLMLLKFACLYSLAEEGVLPAAVALSALAGRCVIVWYVAVSRYARNEGTGKALFAAGQKAGAAAALAVLAAAAFFLAGRELTAILLAVLLFWTAVWQVLCKRVIGGATGDTVGAAEETAEALTLLVFAWSATL